MSDRIYNFSAGPATLPLPVLEQAKDELLSLNGIGMSVLEISHRSKDAVSIFETASENIKKLYGLGDNFKVLFLHGGASLQFSMVPMNLLQGPAKRADYIITGSWSTKAIKEARKEGDINVAWDGKPDNFKGLPATGDLNLTPDASYIYFASNETIQGVQFQAAPEANGVPLVCDASSDIFCRPLDLSSYGVYFAGAQKNAGPAGVGIVVLREDMLERVPEGLPSMLDYKIHVENESMYNTPNVFGVYIIKLVTDWLLETVGGLDKMYAQNQAKAAKLYAAIDNSGGFYNGHALVDCRSVMNVTWTLQKADLEPVFIKEAAENNLSGLKGHRSVGGCRASIYNAMTMAGIDALCDFMQEFARKHG